MQGLVGASGSMKVADTAYTVYVQKKAQGDEEGMRRAMGYASDAMGEANESTKKSGEALTENIEAAREQEKVEQAERLEKARLEAAEKKAETQAEEDDPNPKITNNVDTIEISPEAYAALQSEQILTDAQNSDEIPVEQQQTKQHVRKVADTNEAVGITNTRHMKSGSARSIADKYKKLDIKV